MDLSAFSCFQKLVATSDCVSEHAKSLSSSCPILKAIGRFFPKCKPDGGYEQLQCGPSGFCWCVDEEGNEIPGSRQHGKPKCMKQGTWITRKR